MYDISSLWPIHRPRKEEKNSFFFFFFFFFNGRGLYSLIKMLTTKAHAVKNRQKTTNNMWEASFLG
jgi:hypothetical protein